MPKRTTAFRDDLLADLADPQEAACYLNAALGDSEEMFLVALRDVAEAKQMAKVAEEAGVARESIYRMLAARGNPTYSSLLGILHAVGLKVAIKPEIVEEPERSRDLTKDRDLYRAGMRQQTQHDANSIGEKPQSPASSLKRKDMSSAGSMTSLGNYMPASASL
jgi:probable addiction module antidote protein